ncbi:hypothetical protein [Parerythrobacter lacustris]|uniref:Uncharacterized protein n=1 Tax=Parerythrobacter lacustris TaxID=2969984 RepID=A0ABT1XU56_9SPHN|nr:hypothetical protein [Parerythrobacter lacustris]MCR2835205.1 hypothetical protein [Parerythrobacter lacustris]
MVYRTSKKSALGCAILAAALSIATIILTPIGPILVYGWLVPLISPVIPKPDGVPSRANAEYHWKGFGLVWYWEDRVSGGCARWFASEFFDEPVRGIDVFEGGKNCDEGELTMSRLSFSDQTTLGTIENEWPYEKCPFSLSDASIRRYITQIEEVREATSGRIEAKMLMEMRDEIMQIDRLGLSAEQYGCRVDQE